MLRLQVSNGGHHAHWSDLFEHPAYPSATPALKEHGVASVNNSSNRVRIRARVWVRVGLGLGLELRVLWISP